MCFENSLGEGYVTEKLLDARVMGCKALYWGDISCLSDFSKNGIFNIRDVDSFESAIDWCRKQLIEPAIPPIQWNTVDPSLFAVIPTYENIYRKLAEWTSLVLAWRTFN